MAILDKTVWGFGNTVSLFQGYDSSDQDTLQYYGYCAKNSAELCDFPDYYRNTGAVNMQVNKFDFY